MALYLTGTKQHYGEADEVFEFRYADNQEDVRERDRRDFLLAGWSVEVHDDNEEATR